VRRTLLVVMVVCLAALVPTARAAEVDRAPIPSRLEVGPIHTPEGVEVSVVAWRDTSGPVVCISASRAVTTDTTLTTTFEFACTNEEGATTGPPEYRFDPVSWTGVVSATPLSSVSVNSYTKQPNGDWNTSSSASSSRQAPVDIALRWQANDVAAPVVGGVHYYCLTCTWPSLAMRRPAAVTGVVRFAEFGELHFGGTEPAWSEVSTRVAG
jgi:hypothetical protein